jgi:hypothetical protein
MSLCSLFNLRFKLIIGCLQAICQFVPLVMCRFEWCTDLREKVLCAGKPNLQVGAPGRLFDQ